jgi:hypothetical protein
LVAVLALGPGPASQGTAEEQVHSLEYSVETNGGEVWLQFEVSAPSDEAARDAALRAVQELVPGGVATDLHPRAPDGGVSAAFASWPWLWDRGEIPVPVWYAPDGAPAGTTERMVKDALAPWSAVPNSSFAYRYMGLTDSRPGLADRILDGKNTVGWKNLDCSSGCVLGVTSKLPDAHEVDIVLNSNPAAGIGDGISSVVDLTSVLLHEAGHMAGLEHSCTVFGDCSDAERKAVMYYRYQGVKHALEPDDVAGISALYPAAVQLSQQPGLVSTTSAGLNLAISVHAGWNLVVLPPAVFNDVMQQLPCVDEAYTHDDTGWQSWSRANPAASTIVRADSSGAYWLVAGASCSGVWR